MKLKKNHSKEYLKYWHNNEEINIPRYHFNKNDIRGVWVSNVANIDTPRGLPIDEYQAYLKDMIANIASYNFNTIIFQVRPCSDAYYPSKLNPWSRFITGEEGKDPGFDVLQFVIDEAKKYNIRVHAWMNPYRVAQVSLEKMEMTKEQYLETLHELNFARRHPEHTILDGAGKVILSPSHPEVIEFVTKTIMEVVDNYDVEGVHIDDYFYPYAKIPEEAEQEDYLKYRDFEEQSFDDFRRSNVNKMIKSIHDAMKKSFDKNNRKVDFGISPFAIYRTHSSIVEGGWDKGSYHSAGALQCYSELYSDIYLWMKEGWIDYVVPQVYFPFSRKDVTYHDLVWWWNNICEETKTKLYIGMGIYQMGSKNAEGELHPAWDNPLEIQNQLKFNCQFENVSGVIFFTYKDFVKGQNEIKNEALDTVKKLFKANK